MRNASVLAAVLVLLVGCGTAQEEIEPEPAPSEKEEMHTEEGEKEMILKINDVNVGVTWEENRSVTALFELARNTPLTVSMSMYGGWEQVGAIGRRLPSDDVHQTARPGDIMLYSSDQIVLFYGDNSWSYTKLGTMNLSGDELKDLLGNGDVTMTLAEE